MSAAPKLRSVPDEPITVAQAEVQRAAGELDLAQKHVNAARLEESDAVSKYDLDDSEAMATSAAKARLARERAERRHEARAAELRSAEEALEAFRIATDRAEMVQAITFVGDLPSRLAPELRALVELDRRVGAIVDRIADLVLDGQDAHGRATKLADRLQTLATVQASIRTPTLEWAALLARVAIARDRAKGRDLANGWAESEAEPAWNSPERPAYDAAVATIEAMEKGPGE